MNNESSISRDLLTIAYYMEKNNWKAADQQSFINILYFAGVFSSLFIPLDSTKYDISAEDSKPFISEISEILKKLIKQNHLETNKIVVDNEVVYEFVITKDGIFTCEKIYFLIESFKNRIDWLETTVLLLKIYGVEYLDKLIKVDPNILQKTKENVRTLLSIGSDSSNQTRVVFLALKEYSEGNGISHEELTDYLPNFYNLLYRKYLSEVECHE